MNPLAIRLHGYLKASHAAIGVELDPVEELVQGQDAVFHPLGTCGVLAFFGDYALCGWPPDDTVASSLDAYRILGERLRERGFTRHMVHPRNFRSVKLTRKIGAKPLGVDKDGFMHYLLRAEDYPYHDKGNNRGKEDAAAGTT